MKTGTQDHAELMAQFERDYPTRTRDREPRELWARGAIYQNGDTNELFRAYRAGYLYRDAIR